MGSYWFQKMTNDVKRLRALEVENARLKKMLAETMLENEIVKEALRKKW